MISLLLAICVGFQEPVSHEKPLQFSVTHDGAVGESLDGRLYIMLTRGNLPLIGGPNWFNPEPFFALDVVGWLANTPMLVGENADMMEDSIPSIPSGNWKAVAVFRKQNDRCKIASPGGLYGKAVSFEGSGMGAGIVQLTVNMPVPERTWNLHQNLRLDEKKSMLLSDFYGREVKHGACVIVPDDYDPNREEPYPVMYWIGGYGSDHYGGRYMKMMFTGSDYDDQICRVVLNAQAYTGHHTFTDSANNGPRMTALMQEWIPYLEETYNLGGSADMRTVAGHSSGGWTATWLQLKNPEFFGGSWALAPDSMDFHFFQTVDLYEENANMYFNSDGNEHPMARRGSTPVLFTKNFVAMDDVLKDGGQISSFEAVFSQKSADGRPAEMFNRETGVVNPEVIEHWKQYDIRKYLEDNWDTLSPKLAGKINIVAGGLDTFYLELSVNALQDFFESKNFDVMVRVLEGADHGRVFNVQVIREMDESIAKRLNLPHLQFKASKPIE